MIKKKKNTSVISILLTRVRFEAHVRHHILLGRGLSHKAADHGVLATFLAAVHRAFREQNATIESRDHQQVPSHKYLATVTSCGSEFYRALSNNRRSYYLWGRTGNKRS
jgi:hypothetical protein